MIQEVASYAALNGYGRPGQSIAFLPRNLAKTGKAIHPCRPLATVYSSLLALPTPKEFHRSP